MAKPIIQQTKRANQYVIWNGYNEDDAIGEAVFILTGYNGMIELNQQGSTILINNETVQELCNLMRTVSASPAK